MSIPVFEAVYDCKYALDPRITQSKQSRYLGIVVAPPLHSKALNKKIAMIETYNLKVDTIDGGAWYNVEEVEPIARAKIISIVSQLDKAIEELTKHKEKLLQELEKEVLFIL